MQFETPQISQDYKPEEEKKDTATELVKDKMQTAEVEVATRKDNTLIEQVKLLRSKSEEQTILLGNMLKEFDVILARGKSRNDEMVKKIEDKVIKALQIHPKLWISAEQPIQDVITQLQNYQQTMLLALEKREKLSDYVLFKKASHGCALQGIFLNHQIIDLITPRACLLQDSHFKITATLEQSSQSVKHFSSKSEEQLYLECTRFFGTDIDLKKPLYYGGIEYTIETPTDVEEFEDDETVTYFSTIHCSIVPMGTSFLNDENQFVLSNDALHHLEIIKNTRKQYGDDSPNVLMECYNFFCKFGSHFSKGPITFGGIFWLKCSSSNFEFTKLQEVRELHTRILNEKQVLSALRLLSKVNIDSSILESPLLDDLQYGVQLECGRVGGPAIRCNNEWKIGLATNNDSWNVIGHGTSLKSVWEIIAMNLEQTLGDTTELVDMLRRSWHTLTKQHHTEEILKLLINLGLFNSFPQGLSIEDAVCVKEHTLNVMKCSDPKELIPLLLQKIMVQDCKCRCNLLALPPQSEEFENEDLVIDKPLDATVAINPIDALLSLFHCADDFLRQDIMARLAMCQLSIPLVLVDPFTKKLTFLLWSTSSIVKGWKCREKSGEIEEYEYPINDYNTPIISFLRLGQCRLSMSKSKILNDVLCDSHTDHFFHRDCNGGTFKQLLGNGLIDMCWYLPAGLKEDIFPEAITFLNLHGNASDHERQIAFLSEVSSMCFIFLGKDLDSESIDILNQFPASHLLLTVKNPSYLRNKTVKKQYPLSLVGKNADEIKETIRQKINKFISKMQPRAPTHCLKSCADIARRHDMSLDNDNQLFNEGKQSADTILQLVVEEEDSRAVKRKMLPLQGKDLWQQWAKKDKEQHRQVNRGGKTIEEYGMEIAAQKKEIRNKQKAYLDSLSPMIVQFISALQGLKRSSVFFFLKYLNIGLNNLSRNSIAKLQSEYQVMRNKLVSIQAQSESKYVKSPQEEETRKELDKLHEEWIETSFGLEHLLREIGQVYETALENNEQVQQFEHLPAVAASLLTNGYPLEIMDGDAAHVPINWIQAVIKNVVEKLNNPKIFVLSVLGLQSTGKSTMLNTTFGLQFSVGAGRCTRGAYMQLLPLSDELREKCENCNYVLIVDTEGLRAPELDSQQTQKHDNELATFVIGLANVTLINIYGEVPGDMDDIIQTAVHAFIRMRRVQLKPSCQFVHQNAGANYKSEMGRVKFSQKLDKMTSDAAKEEKCEGQFDKFNDVIKFDDRADVHHFPSLWMGDPPMAPVNHGYCQSAQKLKLHLIDLMKSTKCCSLKEFGIKIGDLWKALLHEKFVFSFKNTLELMAYNSLESHYNQWMWKFKLEVLKWQQGTENEIEAASEDKLDTIKTQKLDPITGELTLHVKKIHEQLMGQLQSYFDESKEGDVIAQWLVNFQSRLNFLAEKLKEDANTHCDKLIKSKKAFASIQEEHASYKKEVVQKVKIVIADLKKKQEELEKNLEEGQKLSEEQLQEILQKDLMTEAKLKQYKELEIIDEKQLEKITSLGMLSTVKVQKVFSEVLEKKQIKEILKKGRISEDQVRVEFEEHWLSVIKDLRYEPKNVRSVKADVETELISFVGKSYEDQIRQKLHVTVGKSSSLYLKVQRSVHVTRKRSSAIMKCVDKGKEFMNLEIITDDHIQQAQTQTDLTLHTAKEYIERKKNSNYAVSYTSEMLHELENAVKSMEEQNQHLNFTKNFEVDVYITACNYAVKGFEEMVEAFNRRTNPIVYIEETLKEQLFSLFKDQYFQLAHEVAVANTLCEPLARSINKQVSKSLGGKVVKDMTASDPSFDTKGTLKVRIMIDLAENLIKDGDFVPYIHYLTKVEESMNGWVKSYIEQHCQKQNDHGISRLSTLAIEESNIVINFVLQKIDEIAGEFDEEESVTTKAWFERFCQDEKLIRRLGDTDELDVHVLHESGGYEDIKEISVTNFTAEVRNTLEKVRSRMEEKFKKLKPSDMKSWENRPEDLLKETIGCCEQCPFCGEQCDYGKHAPEENIKHKAEQHRPTCVIGWRTVRDQIMVTESCPILVSGEREFIYDEDQMKSHPYKEYSDIHPSWFIPADLTMKTSLYWKWFVASYSDKLASHYNVKIPEIQPEWKELKWEDVKQNLKECYNL